MLKPKEKELIELIHKYFSSKKAYPSFSEMQLQMGYASKRSIAVLIEKLVEKGELKKVNGNIKLTRFNDSFNDNTIEVPLLGEISCGIPIFAEQNIKAVYLISTKFAKPGNDYFLLTAIGNSMNKANSGNKPINDGDLVLVKVQNTAEDKNWVVALVNNEATIKEFYSRSNHILLKPSSTEEKHKPLILNEDLQIQGVVVDSFLDLS